MSAAPAFQGCFTYLFLVCFGIMGFLPIGRHSSDFSKDGRQLAYAYRLKEVRLLDVATRKPGPPLYTAPKGYLVDSVHWTRADDEIYAVIHNAALCDASSMDISLDETAPPPKPKWNVKLLRIDKNGGAPATVADRTYMCPESTGFLGDSGGEGEAAPTYANLEKAGLWFKPVGWNTGSVYFVEPEELTSQTPAVVRMDLKTGNTEKVMTLPEGSRTFLLSDDANYLAYSILGENEKNADIVLMDVKTKKQILRDRLVTMPEEMSEEMTNEDAFMGQYLFGLLAGLDSLAAYDTSAGMFFYVKMTPDNKSTQLIRVDIGTGKSSVLLSDYSIYAPVAIPQKKAVLVTTFDDGSFTSPMFDPMQAITGGPKGGGMGAMMPDNYLDSVHLSLVSYEGKTLKNHKMPPLMAPMLHMIQPDAAVSPDGSLVAVNIELIDADKLDFSSMFGGEDEKTNAAMQDLGTSAMFDVLPVIIDIENGTYEAVITEPRDYAVAGRYFYELRMLDKARGCLEHYLAELKSNEEPDMKAVMALYVIYQDENNPLAKELESDIRKMLAAKPDSTDMAFARLYMNTASMSSDYNGMIIMSYCGETCLEMLQDFSGFTPAQKTFLEQELGREAAAGAANAEYLLGAMAARADKVDEAAKHFDRTLALLKSEDLGLGLYYEPTEEELNSMLEDSKKSTGGIFNRICAELYENQGNAGQAVRYYSLFLDTNTDDTSGRAIRKRRAELLESLGRGEEAVEDYQALLDYANSDLQGIRDTRQFYTEYPDDTGFDAAALQEQMDQLDADETNLLEQVKELEAKIESLKSNN